VAGTAVAEGSDAVRSPAAAKGNVGTLGPGQAAAAGGVRNLNPAVGEGIAVVHIHGLVAAGVVHSPAAEKEDIEVGHILGLAAAEVARSRVGEGGIEAGRIRGLAAGAAVARNRVRNRNRDIRMTFWLNSELIAEYLESEIELSLQRR
jgi:hypothetical protein